MKPKFDIVLVESSDDNAVLTVHVDAGSPFFDGHFEGDPILPGVAQLALLEDAAKLVWPGFPAVERLTRLKFKAAIRPNDDLEIELARTEGRVRFVIRKDSQICSQGSFRFGETE